MSTIIGTVGPFDDADKTFELYLSRVESFFLANDIADDKKLHVFLSLIGPKTFKLVTNLLSPIQPNKASLHAITSALKKHYEPQVNIIYERFKFYKRNQDAGESVSAYVAALKALASTCKFVDTLKEYLRDRLVAGIFDDATQRTLLTIKDLTFDLAFETACAREAAAKDSSEMNQNIKGANATHKITASNNDYSWSPHFKGKSVGNLASHQRQTQNSASSLPKSACSGCGALHWQKNCPFLHSICHTCGKKAHISRVCSLNRQQQQSATSTSNFIQSMEPHTTPSMPPSNNTEQTKEDYAEYIWHVNVSDPIHIKL